METNLPSNSGSDKELKRTTTSGSSIAYAKAKQWAAAYLDSDINPDPLRFNGGNLEGQIIRGFRIDASKILSLLESDESIYDLYVFFGMNEESPRETTLLFAGVIPYTNQTGETYDGQVSQTLLYDYVDPCPSKCPKFK